jgi:glycosyltransferase involved in cell wall biosynthesis
VDARAFAETIEDGKNGFKFPFNEKGCADAIAKCIERAEEMSKAARAAAERYPIRETAVKLEKLYEEVASGHADIRR